MAENIAVRNLNLQLKTQIADPKNIIFMSMFVIGFAALLAQLAQSTVVTQIPLLGPILLFLFKGIQPGLLGFGVILRWLIITLIAITMFNFIQAFIEGFFQYDMVWIILGQTALVGILITILIMLPQLLPGVYKQAVMQAIIGG
jgi:hypothetical protein